MARAGTILSGVILTLLAIVLLAAVLAAPAARLALSHWLQQQGFALVSVETVQLRPWEGRLVVEGLQADDQRLGRLEFELGRVSLWDRRLTLTALRLQDLEGSLRHGPEGWHIGALLLAMPAESVGWALNVDRFSLNQSRLRVLPEGAEPLHLDIDELQLGDIRSRDLDGLMPVEARLGLGDTRLAFDGQLRNALRQPAVSGHLRATAVDLAVADALAGGRLQSAGLLDVDAELNWLPERRRLLLSGRLDGEGLAHEGRTAVRSEEVHWQGELLLDPRELTALLTGRAEGRGVAVETAQLAITEENLQWEGRLALDVSAGGQGLDMQGRLEGSRLRLQRPGAMRLQLRAPLWQGNLTLQQDATAPRFSLDGNLVGSGLDLELPAGGMVQCGELQFNGLSGSRQGLQADTVRLQQVVLTDPARSERARVAHLDVDQLSLTPGTASGPRIDVGYLLLAGLDGQIERDAAGQWHLPLAVTGDAGTALPRLALQRLEVSHNSRLRIRDAGVTPMAAHDLRELELKLAELETDNPAAETVLQLSARSAAGGGLTLQGRLRGLPDEPRGRFSATLRAVDLARLNGYLQPLLEQPFAGGRLNLDLVMQREAAAWRGQAHVQLQQPRLAVPGEAPLALLTDPRGNVALDMTFQQEQSRPQAALGDVVAQALARAVIAYYQPLGLRSPVAVSQLQGLDMLELEPLPFAPGDTALSASAKKRLDEVALRLAQRPALQVRLCPAADLAEPVTGPQGRPLAELGAKGQGLRQLAVQRGQAVRNYLLQSGLDAGQLMTCAPELVQSTPPAPRVTIRLLP